MPWKKFVKEKAKPNFEQMPLKVIAWEYWLEVERNQQNLKKAGLWFFILVSFKPQNDHHLRTFVKSSCYTTRKMCPFQSTTKLLVTLCDCETSTVQLEVEKQMCRMTWRGE